MILKVFSNANKIAQDINAELLQSCPIAYTG